MCPLEAEYVIFSWQIVQCIWATRILVCGKSRKKFLWPLSSHSKTCLLLLGTCFQVFYSISILWLHMANNAQSLVNYLEKIVMATNSSGLTWIQPICQEQRERERRERQRARINRWRASANFMQHLVTEFCVILLCFNGLFALELQNEIQLLSRFFCYPWLAFYLIFGWEMCRLTKSSCKSLLSKKYIYIHFNTVSSHCKFGTWQNSEVGGWADRWFWKVN